MTAIQVVYQGQSFPGPAVSKTVIGEYLRQVGASHHDDCTDKLIAREREVLQRLAEGYSNRQIAEQLHLSLKTVGVHRLNLMKKLDIHAITELTKYAIRKDLIDLDQ
ncbi:MAG: LuxR C-terminal-related transcriptional regulator [Caldilineaceae bacterium]